MDDKNGSTVNLKLVIEERNFISGILCRLRYDRTKIIKRCAFFGGVAFFLVVARSFFLGGMMRVWFELRFSIVAFLLGATYRFLTEMLWRKLTLDLKGATISDISRTLYYAPIESIEKITLSQKSKWFCVVAIKTHSNTEWIAGKIKPGFSDADELRNIYGESVVNWDSSALTKNSSVQCGRDDS